jgi:hypothetical protein
VRGRIREADHEERLSAGLSAHRKRATGRAAAGSKLYACYTEIGVLSGPDLRLILSAPTIFPMMPDRVETLILTMTR